MQESFFTLDDFLKDRTCFYKAAHFFQNPGVYDTTIEVHSFLSRKSYHAGRLSGDAVHSPTIGHILQLLSNDSLNLR